ncbi:alpha-amylase family glycosyl hydrolase [Jannaschia aquimarina]|uniref:MalL_2 protein n=1 Tax=Jannaschia aquimarina TaxID=935700 RepID=A0A0D1CRU7_9RHOB|nr:alpha-amylase family glycosyl hydrolase [Jannaschia aquimarina]KIT17532.1 Oligo-1,6-glucosidase 1 [Jannaschia aquimarina]SNS73565.1 alpha-glucosidase [Jannaschia aquimarina]
MAPSSTWPRSPVIYQIYPRSFRDSNGDGIGDLNGIIHKLEHVARLNVDAIWLSPFFPSPLADGGYDVADHIDVHPAMGTLSDFDRLIERARELGLKVLIDQVFNHTSTESPWFKRAIQGDPAFEDFYVWGDPKEDGSPPNNWLSQFGTPAWTWCHQRRQYYFHNFTKDQPSLNLRCQAVQDQMRNVMRFWLDRGVDGFRVDAVTSFLFDPSMKDNPPARPAVKARVSGPDFSPYTWQDHVYDILPGDGLAFTENLRTWAGHDAWIMGEVTSGNNSVELACGLTEPGRLNAAYTTDFPESSGTADAYGDILERADRPEQICWWLSSHDQPRHAGKSGDGSDRDVRFLASVLMLSPGPVLIYQGEELGLCQPTLPRAAVTDPYDLLYWPDGPGREGARVPIPWAEGPGRGFTTGESWLPMDWPDSVSVAVQEIGDSTLTFYRRAAAFRRDSALGNMDLTDWSRTGEVVRLSYEKGSRRLEAVLNFGETATRVKADPAFCSQEFDGNSMPGRTAAAWVVE